MQMRPVVHQDKMLLLWLHDGIDPDMSLWREAEERIRAELLAA